MSRQRVDATDVGAVATWLAAEVGRPGTPLASVGPREGCRTLSWATPAGDRRCLTALQLAALVDARYLVVKASAAGEARVLFPTAAAARVLRGVA